MHLSIVNRLYESLPSLTTMSHSVADVPPDLSESQLLVAAARLLAKYSGRIGFDEVEPLKARATKVLRLIQSRAKATNAETRTIVPSSAAGQVLENFSALELLSEVDKRLSNPNLRRTITKGDGLEEDALGVLCEILSIENSFNPGTRVFSVLCDNFPYQMGGAFTDKDLINMSRVCRNWRVVLMTHRPFWTRLDCKELAKTRVFIERSKPSRQLEITLKPPYDEDALDLALREIDRVKSISLTGRRSDLQSFSVSSLRLHAPTLRRLDIRVLSATPTTLGGLFKGDLSSLHLLRLDGVANLPWGRLSNLTTFGFCNAAVIVNVAQLLDLFEAAPKLSNIQLKYSNLDSSNVHPNHPVVPLRSLKKFTISANEDSSSKLLEHLIIPAGAFLSLQLFDLSDTPFRHSLPRTPAQLENVSEITSVYLWYGNSDIRVRLSGPSGGLSLGGFRTRRHVVTDADTSILSYFKLTGTRQLAISMNNFPPIGELDLIGILIHMPNVRTLFLNRCQIPPFISVLDVSGYGQCPRLKNLLLYVEEELPDLRGLVGGHEQLRLVTVIKRGGFVRGETDRLKGYAGDAKYISVGSDSRPQWDRIPDVDRSWS